MKRLASKTPPQEPSNSCANSGVEAAGKRYNSEEISFNMRSSGGDFPASIWNIDRVYPPELQQDTPLLSQYEFEAFELHSLEFEEH